MDSWDTGGQGVSAGKFDIAFSPGLVTVRLFRPSKRLKIAFIFPAGGRYIDNTLNTDRSLNAWFVNNLKADYSIETRFFKKLNLHVQVNNIFNEAYESNAWVYSYILVGKRYKTDGYFPQAGRHFMIGIDFIF